MNLPLTVLIVAVSLAPAQKASAATLKGLLPYNANVSLVSQSTIDEIEELIKQEVISSLYRAHLGLFPDYPASSCKQLVETRPDYVSGYYWVTGDAGPTGVYCELAGEDVFGKDGGWTRIGHMDMTDGRTECPRGLEYAKLGDKGLCQRPRTQVPGCSSTTFSTQGINYSKVCGKVTGYQYYFTNGFGPHHNHGGTINGIYIDGVSITHGSPRQHIWSLAAANKHARNDACLCIYSDTPFRGTVPSFVGNNYYCETGSRTAPQQQYYFDDPLWDGQGCEGADKCCERGGPWFCTELGSETNDSIEMRVCTNSDTDIEDILLEKIEFYIQ